MKFVANKFGFLFMAFSMFFPVLIMSFFHKHIIGNLGYTKDLLVLETIFIIFLFVSVSFSIIYKDENDEIKDYEIIRNDKDKKIEIILNLEFDLNLFLNYIIEPSQIYLRVLNPFSNTISPSKVNLDNFEVVDNKEGKIIKKGGKYKVKLIFDFKQEKVNYSEVLDELYLGQSRKNIFLKFERGKEKEIEVLEEQLYRYKNKYLLNLKIETKLNNSRLVLFNIWNLETEDKNKISTDDVFPTINKIKGFYGVSINENNFSKKYLMKLNDIYKSNDKKKTLIYKDGIYEIVYFLGKFEDDVSYIKFVNEDIGKFEYDLDKKEYVDLE